MRITSTLAALSIGVVALAIPAGTAFGQAFSAVPGLTLTYTTPTGTVGSHDPIDVYLHMSLDAGASPFEFDGTSPSTNFGLPFALPTDGTLDSDPSTTESFASYSAAVSTISAGCGATLDGCNAPGTAYTLSLFLGAPSWYGNQHFTLNPGDTFDFLFGTFTPNGGTAPAGLYTFNQSVVDLYVDGADANGDPITALVDVARTCDNSLPSCEFTRIVTPDVTGTPEPATFGLLGMGLGFIALVRRRNSRVRL